MRLGFQGFQCIFTLFFSVFGLSCSGVQYIHHHTPLVPGLMFLLSAPYKMCYRSILHILSLHTPHTRPFILPRVPYDHYTHILPFFFKSCLHTLSPSLLPPPKLFGYSWFFFSHSFPHLLFFVSFKATSVFFWNFFFILFFLFFLKIEHWRPTESLLTMRSLCTSPAEDRNSPTQMRFPCLPYQPTLVACCFGHILKKQTNKHVFWCFRKALYNPRNPREPLTSSRSLDIPQIPWYSPDTPQIPRHSPDPLTFPRYSPDP